MEDTQEQQAVAEKPKMYKHKYGWHHPTPLPPLELELQCFLAKWKGTEENPGLGAAGHFFEIVKILWPKGTPGHVVLHPWFVDMTEAACEEETFVFHGSASSGKTDWAAIWALVNWLAAPMHTMVLVTSTSLTDSRKRVWGSITKAFTYASVPLPGKLVDSRGIILTRDGTGTFNDKNAIALIAGERKKERDSIGRIIGLKNKRVILLLDEAPELSPALVTAAKSNLSSNPYFQIGALGNFNSVYDPMGEMSEPVDGWKSLKPDSSFRWRNKTGGITLRLDGLQSPNYLAGEDKWPILSITKIRAMKKDLKGLQLWRMLRSFPCPSGDEALIYTEADLISGEVEKRVFWQTPPTPVAALDPGFTNGGDRSVMTPGKWGLSTEGIWTLQLDKEIVLAEDVEKLAHMPRNHQIAAQFRDECLKLGVKRSHAALDSTGAGIPFLEIVNQLWTEDVTEGELDVLGVQFGGSASDLPISDKDLRPSTDLYVNRVSELWYAGVNFIKYRQIRGIGDQLAKEMTSRYYSLKKSGDNMRVMVEPKEDMKERLGYSPDIADSFFVLLDLCRARLSAKHGTQSAGASSKNLPWEKRVQACEAVYANVTYEEGNDNNGDVAYAEYQ